MRGLVQKPLLGDECLSDGTNPGDRNNALKMLLNEGSGDKVFDLIRQIPLTLTNTSWIGQSIEANDSGEYGTLNNSNEQYISETQGTIVMSFKSNVAFNDGAIHFLFGARGAANNTGDFYIAKWDDDKLYFLLYPAGASRYEAWSIGSFPNWQAGQQLAFQWQMSGPIWNADQIVCLVDGEYVTPTAGNSGSGWTAGSVDASLGVLNDVEDTTKDADGILDYLYIYNRVLTASEMALVCGEPFGDLGPRMMNLYVPPAAEGISMPIVMLQHNHFNGGMAA